MSDPAVADSACLIVLDQIGRTDLLTRLFGTILVPPAVAAEIPRLYDFLSVRETANPVMAAVLSTRMDAGEAEAIALALEVGNAWVILDDMRARRAAFQLGLRVIGTLGLILRAKQNGVIERVEPLLDEVEEAGFYMTPGLFQKVMRLAGETDLED